MIILFLCMFGLSSAVINDLNIFIERLGCSVDRSSPIPSIPSDHTVARNLSTFCSSIGDVASCILEKKTSDDRLVSNFANNFVSETMFTKTTELCSKFEDDNSSITSDLNCLLNTDVQLPCLVTFDNNLQKSSIQKGDLCLSSVSYKYCVVAGLKDTCSTAAAHFMGNYVTQLSGSPETCDLKVKSSGGDSPFILPKSMFNINGTAVAECAGSLIADLTILFSRGLPFNMTNSMSVFSDASTILCGKRETLLSCLKEKMPVSESMLDQFVLLYLDLNGADTLLKNICEKRNVITNNYDCMESNVEEWIDCYAGFNNDFSGDMGFAMADYMCSSFVNTTDCYGRKAKEICNGEIGDLIISSKDTLTPLCRQAKPRPLVYYFEPGWTYHYIPGGVVAAECGSALASDINRYLFSNKEADVIPVMETLLNKVCNQAGSIIDCIEKKLPYGLSRVDQLTREVIDLEKVRQLVTSMCPKQQELADASPCFFERNVQGECFGVINEVLEENLQPFPIAFIFPSTIHTIKGIFCSGDDTLYEQWAKCETNTAKECNASFSNYVKQITSGFIKDKCSTEDEGCTGAKCGANSAVVHGVVWLLIFLILLDM